MKSIKTLRLKIKKGGHAWLNAAAREVNFVWNFCNETSYEAARRTDKLRKWMSGFDLTYLAAGSSKYFETISANIVNSVCLEYAKKRRQSKKLKLKWRSKRSLGWVPFKAADVYRIDIGIRLHRKVFRVFNSSYFGAAHKIHDGCFSQDACGDWWLCIPVDSETANIPAKYEAVGVDLGCKDAAVTNDGARLDTGYYRRLEPNIAQAQRCGHKRQAKRLHRKAANQRRDAQHKFSTMLVRKYGQIFVGDVSSTKLAKTRMAKSVLDAGWGQLRTQLEYKCQQAAREFRVINERNTTRGCSECGALTGPQGLRELVVREWICDACGASHDRDINAARNILNRAKALASVSGNEVKPRMPVQAAERQVQRCYVYFIQQGYGNIKIGVSHDPQARCAQMQTGSAKVLRVLIQFPFESRAEAFAMEKSLHAAYAHLRVNGEWFKRALLRELKVRGRRVVGGTYKNPTGGWAGGQILPVA